jgi:hypothetical protein
MNLLGLLPTVGPPVEREGGIHQRCTAIDGDQSAGNPACLFRTQGSFADLQIGASTSIAHTYHLAWRAHWDEYALAIRARGANAWGMALNRSPRRPLFRQRWFADDTIITCVRW